MRYQEKRINMSALSLAETAQQLKFGEELFVEIHTESNEDSQEIGFAIARVDFLDSELYLIGGCGFYTLSLSVNDGLEIEKLANLIEEWTIHQGFNNHYLKLRLMEIID